MCYMLYIYISLNLHNGMHIVQCTLYNVPVVCRYCVHSVYLCILYGLHIEAD